MRSTYVDTSVLVALLVKEAKSPAVAQWYEKSTGQLVSCTWCITEFASALSLKQRTKQITAAQGQVAWQNFERLYSNDLTLLHPDTETFHQAALLTLDANTGLRAGDALHLAAALQAKVKQLITLDEVFSRNAKALKITAVTV